MNWEEAVELAKKKLGITGWTDEWDNVSAKAHDILSSEAKWEHKEYLNSEEWKRKKEIVLKRDNYLCLDCLKVLPEIIKLFDGIQHEPITFKKLAEEVHHITYETIHTPLEIKHCVSVCGLCHSIRHSDFNYYKQKRKDKLFHFVYEDIIHQQFWKEQIQKQHDDYIQSITVKPNQWLKEEMERCKT